MRRNKGLDARISAYELLLIVMITVIIIGSVIFQMPLASYPLNSFPHTGMDTRAYRKIKGSIDLIYNGYKICVPNYSCDLSII